MDSNDWFKVVLLCVLCAIIGFITALVISSDQSYESLFLHKDEGIVNVSCDKCVDLFIGGVPASSLNISEPYWFEYKCYNHTMTYKVKRIVSVNGSYAELRWMECAK
jgi:hypothetical protein